MIFGLSFHPILFRMRQLYCHIFSVNFFSENRNPLHSFVVLRLCLLLSRNPRRVAESCTLEIWCCAQSSWMSVPGYQNCLILSDAPDAVGIQKVVLLVAGGFMFISRILMLDHAPGKPLEKAGGLRV